MNTVRLQKWSKALPEELRKWTEASPTNSALADREHYTGATHVACVYYFAVILTTRRFLTTFLLPKVREQATGGRPATAQKLNGHGSFGLAHVCLNAAINLANKHTSLVTSGVTLGFPA